MVFVTCWRLSLIRSRFRPILGTVPSLRTAQMTVIMRGEKKVGSSETSYLKNSKSGGKRFENCILTVIGVILISVITSNFFLTVLNIGIGNRKTPLLER